MSSLNIATTIHICEDTEGNFDLRDILASAGYNTAAGNTLKINALSVVLPDGTMTTKDTPLFGKVDADTVYVRPGKWAPNYNGEFATFEFVLDQGTKGNSISLSLRVIVDPVNDAPTGADKTFNLADGGSVKLAQSDFGFVDAVEHDAFQSVIITALPTAGKLLLDGVAVVLNAEISAADIAAGKLSFEPNQSTSGTFEVGFKVRDAGGLVGCGAADTSATPNYLTFKVPQAHLGDLVWEDSNGNGVQDAGEAGLAGVEVQLKDASGQLVASTTTDASGHYHFDVDAGTYAVTVKAPAGYAVTMPGQGDAASDSDVGADGVSAPVVLTPGAVNDTLDAGLYRPASLGDTVWYDTNRNGVHDAGEAGVAGVRVILLGADGQPAGATVTTDADGHYQFSNLKPGSYSVQFDKATLPANYLFTAQGQGADGAADSDADGDTGVTGQVTLASGEQVRHLDAGIVIAQATVGDRVWEDSNGNGVQDDGEAGLDGVVVNLKDADGNVVSSVTTHDGGQYSFTVDPGTYTVAVAPPAGYSFTSAGQGGNGALDSDVGADGAAAITLAPGQLHRDLDAGLYRPASLSEYVWFDNNRDGLISDGETGAAGVRVTLLDAAGKPVPGAVATTDASGHYQFTGLQPGTYSVQFDQATLPAGYGFTQQGAAGAGGSDVNTGTGISTAVTLASGQDATLRAGVVNMKATIGDRVWEDSNGNGVQDDGEAGIAGATVQLKDSSGKVVQTTSTGVDGKYSFTADAGSYTVAVTAPKGYVFTSAYAGADSSRDSNMISNSGSTGQSAKFSVAAGEVNNTIDAGLYKSASVGDRVWFDKNGNGVQDSGEAGIGNVKVTLLDANGKQVGASVYTDAYGNYQFSNLKPGTYSVQFDKSTLPEGMSFTTAHAGSNDALDSDADAAGLSHSFTLSSGQVNKSIDAGVVAAATIGDRVWFDKNGNGVQDEGESGKAGVTMELRDSSGKLVKSTVTDSNGNYKFSVEAGTYSVAMKVPNGWSTTVQHAGSNGALDSDADAGGKLGTVTVAAGQSVTSLDAGIYQTGAIGDRVWYDTNNDGIQQSNEAGARGVKVSLLNEKGVVIATDVTDAYGQYLFTDVGPGKYSVKVDAPDGYLFTKQYQGWYASTDSDVDANGLSAQFTLASGAIDKTRDAGLVKASSIGDTVWEDNNYNGVRDAGEKGVDGVTVKLYDANNVLKATTVTHDGGQYLFDGLAAGNYKVEVTNSAGWYFTKAGVGSDATDSDIISVNGNAGRTGTIVLGTGQHITSEDAGIYRKASIGDKVWRDANHNGVQDEGEEGIGGITVALYDAATKKQIGTSVKTDANGNYKFADLTPGNYYLVFDKTDVKFKGYNMSDWKWGVKNTGTNDKIDSDVTGDAKALTNVTKTDTITLTSGKNDMSWDAGITPIAIDLGGDGIHTIARQDMTGSFDLLGTGKAIQTGWLSKGDGFLAIDSNGNGQIDDISELFGGIGKGQGFAKLASYDSNGDGVIDVNDAGFASLLVWQDANSDGKTDAGELMSLTQAGVASLKLSYTDLAFLDANNNLHMESSTVTMSNGSTAAMTDVYFNVAASDAAAAGVTAPTIDQLMADATQVQLVGQCPVYFS